MTENITSTREFKFRAWDEHQKKMIYLRGLYDNNYLLIESAFAPKMQYTGYVDINKTDIYGGDILKDEYNRVLLVDWRRGGFCFKAITKTNFVWTREIDQWFEYDSPRPLIIGNVHDNPEMLGDDSE